VTATALDPSALLATMPTCRLGRPLVCLPSCASTNDEMAARAMAGAEEGTLIVAEEQTSGRGRRGRVWHSPASENLTFSLLLRPALPARQATPLTLLAGAALATSLVGLGFSPRLKWPNDVLLDTPDGLRKVAGILTEMASEGDRVRHVVLGVGINVNSETFPGELVTRATSLFLARGQRVDRGEVLAAFVRDFEPIYADFVAHGPSAGLATWNRHALLGQACSIDRDGKRIEGMAKNVDQSGALMIRIASGDVISVHAGEVNWLSSG
jgi:BirA family transcriptional regulator, biotin operon repressor / biotin---[acetyl-CoA-carboxylase] ligase